MRKKIFAGLVVMSLLMVGSLLYVPGLFASDTVESEVGVRFFRVEDPLNEVSGGLTAPNVGELVDDAESELERTADGISMELETSGLPAGVYSIWWLIDNGGDDTTGASPGLPLLFGVEIAILATGGIVGDDGEGEFEATLAAGPIPPVNGANVLINGGGSQVLDPMGARIAIVIRYHGPVIPAVVNDQVSVFAGGCSNMSISELPGALPGGNSCFDPQVTEFHVPGDEVRTAMTSRARLSKRD